MKRKGFASSAILYTMLLLFLVLMVNILNNLQNKKVILDALKEDTINALQSDTIIDAMLDQIALLNNYVKDFEKRVVTAENEIKQIQEEKSKRHSFLINHTYNATTDIGYTGLNITIPKNSFFCITAKGGYQYSPVLQVSICDSATRHDYVTTKANAEAGGNNSATISATYCGYTNLEDIPLYVWGRHLTANQNVAQITGFYIPA